MAMEEKKRREQQQEEEAAVSAMAATATATLVPHETITLCIPCTPSYRRRLPYLMASVEAQTRPPDEVVVAITQTTADAGRELERQLQDLTTRTTVRVLATLEQQRAGPNRNRCVAGSAGDVVSFMDPDDMMHPQRLELLEVVLGGGLEALPGVKPQMVLTSFARKAGEMPDRIEASDVQVLAGEDFYDVSHQNYAGKADHIVLPASMGLPKIAHGHLTARRELFDVVQFGTKQRGQDSVFVMEANEELRRLGGTVVFFAAPLHMWLESSGKPMSSRTSSHLHQSITYLDRISPGSPNVLGEKLPGAAAAAAAGVGGGEGDGDAASLMLGSESKVEDGLGGEWSRDMRAVQEEVKEVWGEDMLPANDPERDYAALDTETGVKQDQDQGGDLYAGSWQQQAGVSGQQHRPSIAIVTAFHHPEGQGGAQNEYFETSHYKLDEALDNWTYYANKHGYALFFMNDRLFREERNCAWVKLELYKKYFDLGYDWVFYSDIDFYFFDTSQRLEDKILSEQAHVVVSAECLRESYPNKAMSGTMMLRNSDVGHRLIREWEAKYETFKDVFNHDQKAFEQLTKEWLASPELAPAFQFLPHNEFMTYPQCWGPHSSLNVPGHRPWPFGVHFVGPTKKKQVDWHKAWIKSLPPEERRRQYIHFVDEPFYTEEELNSPPAPQYQPKPPQQHQLPPPRPSPPQPQPQRHQAVFRPAAPAPPRPPAPPLPSQHRPLSPSPRDAAPVHPLPTSSWGLEVKKKQSPAGLPTGLQPRPKTVVFGK
ncbi:unnamed protein product [Chrysoparadoxa australica]